MRLLDENVDLRTISPLTLAFVGDAVYDLIVREMLVCEANRPVGALSAFKRGKNAHAQTVPKHADKVDYHTATGLEALFGYLYLKGEIDRIRELFSAGQSHIDISSD